MPGDDLVPEPVLCSTRSVTIEAPLCVQAAFYQQSQPSQRVVVHLR